jgi:hypothetical protein
MSRSTKKEPRYFAGYVHDARGPLGSIISTCCEGPDCEICATDPEAAQRAGNKDAMALHAAKARQP